MSTTHRPQQAGPTSLWRQRRTSRGTAGILAVLLLSLAAGHVAQAQPITIDDFTTNQGPLTLTAPGQVGSTLPDTVSGGGILSSERDIEVALLGGGFNTVEVQVLNGFGCSHSQGVSVTATATLVWDGADGNAAVIDPTGLGGVDLTVGGTQDAFLLSLISADLNSTLALSVFTDAGNASDMTLNLPGGAANDAFAIPYNTFATFVGAGADFTNVGAVVLTIDGSAVSALDVNIELLRTTALVAAQKTATDLNGGNVEPGDVIEYTVTIENADDAGDATATGVTFTEALVGNLELDCTAPGDPATTQGTIAICTGGAGGGFSANVGDVVDGDIITITYRVTISDPVGMGVIQVCNQGTVASDTLTAVLTDNPGTVTPDDALCLPVCDDTDGDTVCDHLDICPGSPDNVDTDSDGVPDGCDLCPGFNDNLDADTDGVPDACDVCAGFDDSQDGDLDNVPNGCDNCPIDFNPGQGDADGDGIGDACDTLTITNIDIPTLGTFGFVVLAAALALLGLASMRRLRRRSGGGGIGLFLVLLLLGFGAPELATAQSMMIDDFTNNQGPLILTAPGDVGTTLPDTISAVSGILGNERDIEVALLSGGLNNVQSIVFDPFGFSHSQGTSVTATSTLVWDGPDGDATSIDATGLGGIDVTVGGT
ncbi:MAG: hypothetical protein GY856_22895, partial [bacterium]|nr:hypothetical protein [bacterium]